MMTKTLYRSKVAVHDAADFPELHRLLGSTWASVRLHLFLNLFPHQWQEP